MKIELNYSSKAEDIEYLTQKIDEEIKEYGSSLPFLFFIKNKDDQIIAGCNGCIIFGCIYTDQLWVDPDYRHQSFVASFIFL